MTDPVAPTHFVLTTEIAKAIQAYLGQRPAAETARMLVALEACPGCNMSVLTSPAAEDAVIEGAVAAAEVAVAEVAAA